MARPGAAALGFRQGLKAPPPKQEAACGSARGQMQQQANKGPWGRRRVSFCPWQQARLQVEGGLATGGKWARGSP